MYNRKISVDLFREMSLICRAEEENSKGKRIEYFQKDKISLDVFDKDVMLNDSQKGDEYIFIIKANGYGTHLMRADGESKASDMRLRDKWSKYFHMKLDGINSGEIMEVTNRDAKKIVSNSVNNDMEPRRRGLIEQLDEITGRKIDNSLLHTKLGFEFQPNKGDKSLIRLSVGNGTTLIAHVLRTKMNNDPLGDVSVKKSDAYYYMDASQEVADSLKTAPRYFEVNTTEKNYAEIDECGEMNYFKAKNIVADKERTQEESFSY